MILIVAVVASRSGRGWIAFPFRHGYESDWVDGGWERPQG